MFFSSWILTKKGPLAKVWLAAHWEKKLTKNEVQLVDLNDAVMQIIDPRVPISCRTQGELLLGCTKIYYNKVSFLLKESSEAILLLSKKPSNAQEITITEPAQEAANQSTGKGKSRVQTAVTIPIGVDDLMQVPELASFNVADMIGMGDDTVGVVLKGAEDFIPDDWFQQNEEFQHMSQLPPGIEPKDIVSPARSSKSRGSVDQPVQGGDDPGLITVHDISDKSFIEKYINKDTPGVASSTVTPGMDAPVLDLTPTTIQSEESVPVQKQIVNQVDQDTKLTKYKKILQSSSALVRQFAPIPPTEEALGCKQDMRLNPTELILMCEPMRKRKLDLAFGDNVYNIGRTPEVVTEEEKGDKDVEGQRQGVFQEVIGKTLTEVANRETGASSSVKGYLRSMRTPASTVPTGLDNMLEFDLPMETPMLDMQYNMPEVYEPTVDPAISARETLTELRNVIKGSKPVAFTKLTPHEDSRAAAATRFMDMLFLASKSHISLEQKKPYSEILIHKGVRFDDSITTGHTTATTPKSTKRRKSN